MVLQVYCGHGQVRLIKCMSKALFFSSVNVHTCVCIQLHVCTCVRKKEDKIVYCASVAQILIGLSKNPESDIRE